MRILCAGAAVLVFGSLFLLRRAAILVAVGCAYKAKILCSAIFVSGMNPDLDHAEEVSAEVYWPMKFFSARVDRATRSVTTSCCGLVRRRAVARATFGAALFADPTEGPSESPKREGRAPVASSSTNTRLQRVVSEAFSEPDPSQRRRTRAVVVQRDGDLLAEKYAAPITADTPLCGWSMTKGVMAMLIGSLAGKGILALSKRELLDQWREDDRARISLEDLLRMRSGLRFSEVYSDMGSDVNRMLFREADCADFAASRPLAHQPGTTWKYTSGTTNVVSLIARRALGEDGYPLWPRKTLFEPLDASSAVFETDAAGTFLASSYLFATARDWAKFGQLMLQQGLWEGARLLPEGWTAFLGSPTEQSPDLRYGAHWWRRLPDDLGGRSANASRIPSDALHALGHEGQCLSIIPSLGLVVVRLGLSINIRAWDHARFLAEVIDAAA